MKKRLFGLLAGLLLLAACSGQVDGPTPQPPEPTLAATATVTRTATPSPVLLTPSPTFPPTLTATLPPTDSPPTETPLPSPTPGPFEHQILAGDDCIAIVYQYGHVDLDVLTEFYALNNMGGGCSLPGPGAVVMVPRPTGTAIPPELLSGPPTITPFFTDVYLAIGSYEVVEEDTITSVALKNNASVRQICEFNPLPDGLDCRGCDFSESDVGFCPNPPLLSVGQVLNVPGPTPTPSPTSPPTGDETATPTPTHRAPELVYPSGGVTVTGRVRLQWVSVGLLQPDEYYVVTLVDQTTGAPYIEATRNTFVTVPPEYVPTDGQTHNVTWSVSVERQLPDGLYSPVGGRSFEAQFMWE